MGNTAKIEKTKNAVDDKFDDIAVEDAASELLDDVDKDDDKEDEIFAKEEVTKNLDATQLYLGEIGFSPLLSAEEEVFFCP